MNDITSKSLERKREGRMVAGVCMGISVYFSLPVSAVRVAFVVTAVLPFLAFIGAIVYVVAWAVVPEEGESESIVEHLLNKGKG
jgi:phage shock protein C